MARSRILTQATGVVATRDEAVDLFDEDDRRYFEFTACFGVTSTGRCHPRVVEAAETSRHCDARSVHHCAAPPPTYPREADELVLPTHLDKMFPANPGSETVEAALCLALQAVDRPNIIAFHRCFHGRTLPAASLADDPLEIEADILIAAKGIPCGFPISGIAAATMWLP